MIMDDPITLTVNIGTLLALGGSAIRISNAITRLTTIQEQHSEMLKEHSKRLTRLERGCGRD